MSSYRAASRAAPVLLRGGRRAIYASRALPSQLPAVAILIPRRALATETSTGSGGAGQPPPGFNIDQAKKPLPQEQKQATTKQEESSSKSTAGDLRDQVSIPRDAPSAHPPTKAAEARSLSELAAEKAAAEKADEKKLAKKKEEEKKLTIWQKVKKEIIHYWDGTKLLAAEVRISSRLALKMAAGYELTRRENRQVRLISVMITKMTADEPKASKNGPGSGAACTILGIRHRAVRRISASSSLEALPQPSPQHVRRRSS